MNAGLYFGFIIIMYCNDSSIHHYRGIMYEDESRTYLNIIAILLISKYLLYWNTQIVEGILIISNLKL